MLILNQKVDWLEGIIEAVHDGVLVIDRDGIVRLINDEYTRITGVKREQIIGKKLTDVRPGAILPTVLRDGRPREGVFRREKTMEYVVDMAPIYNNGEIIGAVSVCKSLSEVYELSKELSKSRKRIIELEKRFGNLHRAKYKFSDIVGETELIKELKIKAKKFATTDLNMLITGESGTGKELFAQAIHNESKRKNNPFVTINCAAIPDSLLESELFGYEEGAFTNSKRGGKIGLFELANHGTLFLDEIGDMPHNVQAKLLRVLQEGTFRKVGGVVEQKVDVRIIAATNKDLKSMVNKERFREDLFYRINAVQLSIPPLRERKDDIGLIVPSIIKKYCHGESVQFDEVIDIFQQYDWPGNIRELKNTIQYAVSLSEGGRLKFDDLPDTIKQQVSKISNRNIATKSLDAILKDVEREVIIQILKQTGTTVKGKKKAAKQLGISLASLYNKIANLNIEL